MKLSKIFITLMLSMTAYIAQAQLTVQFSWPEYEVNKGEEFIFDVSCETSDSFTAFTCIINLPEGLTPCRWDDDPNEDFEVELTDRAHRTQHQHLRRGMEAHADRVHAHARRHKLHIHPLPQGSRQHLHTRHRAMVQLPQ